MHTLMRMLLLSVSLALLAGTGGHALAAGSGTTPAETETRALPAWDQLSPAQQALLVAPMRQRWNENPGERARMLEHAKRWQSMSPDERRRAHRGMHRWERMDPAHRRAMRALFGKMRTLTPEQRTALRERWHAMSPAQRQAWVEANPPRD